MPSKIISPKFEGKCSILGFKKFSLQTFAWNKHTNKKVFNELGKIYKKIAVHMLKNATNDEFKAVVEILLNVMLTY